MFALLALLLAMPVQAQSRGCLERPRGPDLPLTAIVPAGPPHGRVALGLGEQPVYGQDCIAVMPPAGDVLRGPSSPGGLLRGEARGDPLSGQ